MKETLNHKILQSFYSWVDYKLTKDLEAYQEKETQLYYNEDYRIPFESFSSPYKQWVVDSSSNAYIPTGIVVNGTGVPFSNDTFIDWNNGRLITSEFGENDSIVCKYSTKEINVYITNDNEEDILFQNKYQLNPVNNINPETGIPPYELCLPACFILNTINTSVPYSFGSSDFQKKTFTYRTIIMTDNTYHLDGFLSEFENQNNKSIKVISLSDSQFNQYGALKNKYISGYNYENLNSDDKELLYIESIKGSKISIGSTQMPNKMKTAFVDFKLVYMRKP